MYNELVALFKASNIPFAEFAWDQRPDGTYGVISTDGEADSLTANGHKENQAPQGTVDLYTRENDRTAMQTVQDILNGVNGCAWYLNAVQYEDTTRLIHWEWVFTLDKW